MREAEAEAEAEAAEREAAEAAEREAKEAAESRPLLAFLLINKISKISKFLADNYFWFLGEGSFSAVSNASFASKY